MLSTVTDTFVGVVVGYAGTIAPKVLPIVGLMVVITLMLRIISKVTGGRDKD